MRRFFVEPALLAQRTGLLSGDLYRHLIVLRLKPGDTIRLADGQGNEALARITALDKESARIDIDPPEPATGGGEPVSITLFQGLPKGDKLDLILQKCTELGIARIVPFVAERSVARLSDEKVAKKVQRWEKIVMEASRQSGRSSIPAIGCATDLASALAGDTSALRLLLWEGEKEQGLRPLLEHSGQADSVAIVIGPEGGLTVAEAAVATAAGFQPVTLGTRILRTETAGPAVVAIVQYELGDMG